MARAPRIPSPCDGCDARCCRSYTVYLTGGDVHRIAAGTGEDPVRFLAYTVQALRTATGFLLRAGGPTHDLILETADGDHSAPKPCRFLRVDEATGEGRCGIYALRPGACRRFPAVRGGGGGVGVRDGIVCPDGAWAVHSTQGLSWRVALAREERERALYAIVVADWNDRVEATGQHAPPWTLEAYLDHLAEAYGFISQLRHGLPPRDAAGSALLLRVGEGLRALRA